MISPVQPLDTITGQEILSQPTTWRQAVQTAETTTATTPRRGESVAVVGCGTSYYIAMAYARLRESSGHGETDAFPASEFPPSRRGSYDRVVGITRSGTTTEVIDLLREVDSPTLALTGVPDSPVVHASQDVITFPYADERSVVQTRFATTVLAFLRATLGEDLTAAIHDADTAMDIDVDALLHLHQVSFLGSEWTTGLAEEAALKCREAAQLWTESYASMEYRHGPKAIAEPGRGVWTFGALPAGLGDEVSATGADHINHSGLDPLAQLIVAQRFAVSMACRRGLDPDNPRNLSRSVVLDESPSA